MPGPRHCLPSYSRSSLKCYRLPIPIASPRAPVGTVRPQRQSSRKLRHCLPDHRRANQRLRQQTVPPNTLNQKRIGQQGLSAPITQFWNLTVRDTQLRLVDTPAPVRTTENITAMVFSEELGQLAVDSHQFG